MELISYLFINGKEIHKFKAKDSEIVSTPLCLEKVSKDWSVELNGLNGYVHDFSVDYHAIAVADILDIYKYLMKKMRQHRMFDFLKQIFISTMMFFGCNLSNVNPLKSASMSSQECKIRAEIVNINSDDPTFYPYSVKISKCSGSCNNINDPYAKICIPDVIKNMNIKVFSLMSRTNETRYIKSHESCKCKCRLDASVCKDIQLWNEDKCRCECKELIDKGCCD